MDNLLLVQIDELKAGVMASSYILSTMDNNSITIIILS